MRKKNYIFILQFLILVFLRIPYLVEPTRWLDLALCASLRNLHFGLLFMKIFGPNIFVYLVFAEKVREKHKKKNDILNSMYLCFLSKNWVLIVLFG